MPRTQAEYQKRFENAFSCLPVSVEMARVGLQGVAEDVWYNGFVPNLSSIKNHKALRRAAYVLDYLASNHMVAPELKRELKQRLEVVKKQLDKEDVVNQETFYQSDKAPRTNRDAFAKRWHLASGMKPRDLGLLDMQRRVNAHKHVA